MNGTIQQKNQDIKQWEEKYSIGMREKTEEINALQSKIKSLLSQIDVLNDSLAQARQSGDKTSQEKDALIMRLQKQIEELEAEIQRLKSENSARSEDYERVIKKKDI